MARRMAAPALMAAARAVVGLELAGRTYLAGDALRDRAQHALPERLDAALHPTLRWLLEGRQPPGSGIVRP